MKWPYEHGVRIPAKDLLGARIRQAGAEMRPGQRVEQAPPSHTVGGGHLFDDLGAGQRVHLQPAQ